MSKQDKKNQLRKIAQYCVERMGNNLPLDKSSMDQWQSLREELGIDYDPCCFEFVAYED